MHSVLPNALLDRLLYHHSAHGHSGSKEQQATIDQLQAYDYMFYASAVLSVLQLMEVGQSIIGPRCYSDLENRAWMSYTLLSRSYVARFPLRGSSSGVPIIVGPRQSAPLGSQSNPNRAPFLAIFEHVYNFDRRIASCYQVSLPRSEPVGYVICGLSLFVYTMAL